MIEWGTTTKFDTGKRDFVEIFTDGYAADPEHIRRKYSKSESHKVGTQR